LSFISSLWWKGAGHFESGDVLFVGGRRSARSCHSQVYGQKSRRTESAESLLNTLLPNETLLADCGFASDWKLATAWQSGFDIVVEARRQGLRLAPCHSLLTFF
jgi:hypothetical protein